MTRQDLRKKGVDIVVHPVLIGTDDGQDKRYTFSIFDKEEEVGSMENNPDFESYEQAEEAAVCEAVMWVQIQEN